MPHSIGETIFWLSVAACAIAEGFILLSSFRAARKQPAKAIAIWEAVWAILPAVALAFVLGATWHAMHRDRAHEKMNMPMAAMND